MRRRPMIDSSCFDGTISPGEFRTAVSALVERWKHSSSSCSALPIWSWVSPPRQPWLLDQVDGYLALEKLRLPRPGKEDGNTCCTAMEDPNHADSDDDDDSDLIVDNATLVESADQEKLHYYDFHVVYSSSFRVPLLYFRVCTADGQPLALSEFERDLPLYLRMNSSNPNGHS